MSYRLGELKAVIPCGDGKRGIRKNVPEQIKRSSGVAANYLCDNSSYLLGLDAKGDRDRSARCFEASKQLHFRFLSGLKTPFARAILLFFDKWDPFSVDPTMIPGLEDGDFLGGGCLTFCCFEGTVMHVACDDEELKAAWLDHSAPSDDQEKMVSLVTGGRSTVARLHPAIKGVYGAQSMGASLVGFNCESFESYGHNGEQGRNAPVDIESVHAYATALGYLLDRQEHRGRIGDTTIVFWSSEQKTDLNNCMLFNLVMGLNPLGVSSSFDPTPQIKGIVDSISRGRMVDSSELSLGDDFFLLGLAPNAARLSVRFFLRGAFGEMMKHLASHYRISEVCHSDFDQALISPYRILKSVENPNSKKSVIGSQLGSSLMRAVLFGSHYPEALYENILLRVRAERTVEREHAAIIKAYLIRNKEKSEEEVTVDLNTDSVSEAYILGRVFAYLEQIQEKANNGKGTIAERYLGSACATPATVFPILLKLSNSHLAKISRDYPGLAVFFEKRLSELLARLDHVFPKRLSLVDQGTFFLGYYQQKQDRYKANDSEESL